MANYGRAIGLVVLVLGLAVPHVYGATHTVGDSSGWTQGVDYTSWASGQTFTVGDSLVFSYGSSHSVSQVSKDGYDNCQSSSPIKHYSSGSDTVPLSTAGMVYFICPTSGHCDSGMKVAINVVAASTTPTTPTTPATGTPPTTSGTPPTTSTPAPPPPNGASGIAINNVMLLVSFLVAAAVGFLC